jgi:hypothetical protein
MIFSRVFRNQKGPSGVMATSANGKTKHEETAIAAADIGCTRLMRGGDRDRMIGMHHETGAIWNKAIYG